MNDAKVGVLSANNEELKRYIDRSSPRIGLPHATRKCNHFDLLSYLASKHSALLSNNLQNLPSSTVGLASDLLCRWPFRNFSGGRKRGIIKVIQSRFDRLMSIA